MTSIGRPSILPPQSSTAIVRRGPSPCRSDPRTVPLVVEDTELHRLLRDRGGEPRFPQYERKRCDNVATHENPPLVVATVECRSCWRDRTGEEHHCNAVRWFLLPRRASARKRYSDFPCNERMPVEGHSRHFRPVRRM